MANTPEQSNIEQFFAVLDKGAAYVGLPVDERVGGIAAGLGRKQSYERRLRAQRQQSQPDDSAPC